eukprot:2267316-Pyramimonas_sp.AAC.1
MRSPGDRAGVVVGPPSCPLAHSRGRPPNRARMMILDAGGQLLKKEIGAVEGQKLPLARSGAPYCSLASGSLVIQQLGHPSDTQPCDVPPLGDDRWASAQRARASACGVSCSSAACAPLSSSGWRS